LVQSQTTVANCSEKGKIRQALKYAADFTIRPFNTNFCITANSTMLLLEACTETSTIWGTFNHTGQLMDTDRKGLRSKATNRKCLTIKSGTLGLGHCHDGRKKQQFSFEYKNPYQPKTLSAATIIAWDTNQTTSLMENNEIPPMAKREIENKIFSMDEETDSSVKTTSTTIPPPLVVGSSGPPGRLGPPGSPGHLVYQVHLALKVYRDNMAPTVHPDNRVQGASGSTGATGPSGPKGENGMRGPTGTPGEDGIHGMDGLPGPTGPEGPIGKTGNKGEAGSVGYLGNTGPTGEPGPRGVLGILGMNGAWYGRIKG
jgi:hypothetical protein